MRIFAPSPSLLSGVGGRGLAPLHHRFEFQIFARATRVERAARTNFRMFLPAYALSFVSLLPPLLFHLPSPPDLRYLADFIYGGTDYVSELIP